MKLIKTLVLFTLISAISFSCKEEKKEDLNTDTEAVETEAMETEAVETGTQDVESTEVESEEIKSTAAKSAEPAQSIEHSAKEVEEIKTQSLIVEAIADTPVIYPGCSGSLDEIRACSIKEFIAFFQKEVDDEVINSLDLEAGIHHIRGLLKIDQSGKVSVQKVQAEKKELEKEFSRVIGLYPVMTPATKDGMPVSVSFVLPIKYKVAN